MIDAARSATRRSRPMEVLCVPGGEDTKRIVGRDHLAAEAVKTREFCRGAPGGPAIPACGWVSCPRGGRHDSHCRSGSRTTGRRNNSSMRWLVVQACVDPDVKRTAQRSRPMDRSRAPGGEGTRLAVGRDPRAVVIDTLFQ